MNTPRAWPDAARRRAAALAGLTLCAAAWPRALRAADARAGRVRATRELMGTRVDLIAEGGDTAALDAAIAHAYDVMARQAALMSHYSATSGAAAIGLAAGLQPVKSAPELMAVLQQAQAVSRRSGGAFDATVGSAGRWHFDPLQPRRPSDDEVARGLPLVNWRDLLLDERAGTALLRRRGMRLDLGGIAKLPILDAGLRALRDAGVERALVNGGGDVLAIARDDQPAWRIGVRDPRRPERVLGVLALRRGVLASSGDYLRCFEQGGRRLHHIIDPRSGQPSQGAHGVTLLAERVQDVNGFGAAAMVMNDNAARTLFELMPGVRALIARRDGSLWTSPGLPLQAALGAEGLPLASG
ncbi:FAD:protein FMN transferase [Piscinibacter sp.]|uniref:FAD:protein FMN transferase n=1 Tax=Piscinibacter sp. TaxID=1903157 RepID=UPI0039E24465